MNDRLLATQIDNLAALERVTAALAAAFNGMAAANAVDALARHRGAYDAFHDAAMRILRHAYGDDADALIDAYQANYCGIQFNLDHWNDTVVRWYMDNVLTVDTAYALRPVVHSAYWHLLQHNDDRSDWYANERRIVAGAVRILRRREKPTLREAHLEIDNLAAGLRRERGV